MVASAQSFPEFLKQDVYNQDLGERTKVDLQGVVQSYTLKGDWS